MPIESLTQYSSTSKFLNKVCFDPESALIKGVYTDELSAYRAKRIWNETLEENFFLEDKIDFSCKIVEDLENQSFNLLCSFSTPCGRYAFWRITNYQSPETQYIMETAHIPFCEAREDEILSAAELVSLIEEQFLREDLENSAKIVFNSKTQELTVADTKNVSDKILKEPSFFNKICNKLVSTYCAIFSFRS
jgi:hypothetical protein